MSLASRAARISEHHRALAIKQGTARVNELYGGAGRQQQYDDFLNALRSRYQTDLGDQKRIADRLGKFNAARRGLTAGSADFDARRRRGEDFIRALIGAETSAQGSVSRLRTADEGARQSALAMVQGGMDASTNANRAQSIMRSNLQTEMADFMPAALSSLAGVGADVYMTGARNDAYQRGIMDARAKLYG